DHDKRYACETLALAEDEAVNRASELRPEIWKRDERRAVVEIAHRRQLVREPRAALRTAHDVMRHERKPAVVEEIHKVGEHGGTRGGVRRGFGVAAYRRDERCELA